MRSRKMKKEHQLLAVATEQGYSEGRSRLPLTLGYLSLRCLPGELDLFLAFLQHPKHFTKVNMALKSHLFTSALHLFIHIQCILFI